MKIRSLLSVVFVLIVVCWVGCESDPTPEEFVISKLKESLHDPKSLEVISITPSQLGSTYKYLWGEDTFARFKEKELANGDPFTVFHIKYRATNIFGALRKQESFAVYGHGVVTDDAVSDDVGFGHFCYFIKSNQ